MQIIKDKETGATVLASSLGYEIIDPLDEYFFKLYGAKEKEDKVVKDVLSSTFISYRLEELTDELARLLFVGKAVMTEQDLKNAEEQISRLLKILKGGKPSTSQEKRSIKWLDSLKKLFRALLSLGRESASRTTYR